MNRQNMLKVRLGDIEIKTPVIIASGVWPMSPDMWPAGTMDDAGAICSKGITDQARTGNTGKRLCETPSGLLNSIGLQNPGIDLFISNDLPDLYSSGTPVVVNIAFETLDELTRITKKLNRCKNMVASLELNVSCPNVSLGGMAWCSDMESLYRSVSMARLGWEGPLWVKLSPQARSIGEAAHVCESAGADALVIGNTWLGMSIDNEAERPFFDRVFAGLSGPAIFPLSLRLVWEASGSVNIPVIGCGGVIGSSETISMLLAGASAVEVGTALFWDSRIVSSICSGLLDHMENHNAGSVMDLVGRAHRIDNNDRRKP